MNENGLRYNNTYYPQGADITTYIVYDKNNKKYFVGVV